MSTNVYIGPQLIVGMLLGKKPSMDRKRQVAGFLADKAGRSYHFSVGYIENIVAGRQIPPPGGDMHKALELVMEEVVTALLEKI